MKRQWLLTLIGLCVGTGITAQSWNSPSEYFGAFGEWCRSSYYQGEALGGGLVYGRAFADPFYVEVQGSYHQELAGSREATDDPRFRTAALALMPAVRLLEEKGFVLGAGVGLVFRYFSYDLDRFRLSGAASGFALPGLGLQASAGVRFHPDFELGLLGFFQYFEKGNEVSGGGVVLKWMIR